VKLPLALHVCFAVALAIVFGTAAISYRNSKTLLSESEWVLHSNEIREVLSKLLLGVEAATTAERGFIVTGDETYLAPNNAAQREVPDLSRRLRALTAENAEQQWRLRGLEPHIEALLQWLRETTVIRREGILSATEQRASTALGKGEIETIRDGIGDMRDAENRLLQQRAEAVDTAAHSAAKAFVVTAILATALIVGLYAVVRRHERVRAKLLSQEQAARRAAEEAAHKLEEADRAKDVFLATVSHELRTPLSPIVTWAEVLRRGNLDAEQFRLAVEAIQRSANAQAQLLEDLLDVSRIVAGKMRFEVRPVDLADVIQAAVDVVRPAANSKGIRLQTELDAKAAYVSADADRLQQVVWNLLSNAVKFTQKGGRVTVVLEEVNSHVEIAVSDTGKGIAQDFLPHLFERFRQADAARTVRAAGLGLGLAIVRHIVEAHGGTVHGESPGPNLGSTFTVRLPLMPMTQTTEEAQHRHPAEMVTLPGAYDALKGLRVLTVDDEPDSNEAIRALLCSCGAEVRLAGSAAEALDILGGWVPDVLVSDLGMPGEDGYALIAKVRAREDGAKNIPAIALTGFAGVEDRERLLSAGFQIHVPKPVEPAELFAAMTNLARRG
jgi:signal transduction histidine kinase